MRISGGPFDNNKPGEEAAEISNINPVPGRQLMMYGDGDKIEDYPDMIMRVSIAVNRARISLDSQGQDLVDKIA